MKKIMLILFIMLISCDDDINQELKEIGLKIIEKPELLLDLKSNFPEYYSDSLIYDKMKESNYLNNLIYEINKFKNIKSNIKALRLGTFQEYLDHYKKAGYKYDLSPDNIYAFFMLKNDIGIGFYFLIKDNKYIIFYIKKDFYEVHN